MLEPEQALCYHNLSNKFVQLAIINAASSLLSLLVCLLVMAIILLLKKIKLFNKRLVFYLSIAGALNGLAGVTRGSAYFPINELYSFTSYCAWSGFSVQVTDSMCYMALLVIFIDTYLRLAKQKDTSRFEKLYIPVIFILPFVFDWIPFTYSAYGQAGPWCWIRAINFDQNCTVDILGLSSRIVLSYVPLAIVCTVGILLNILMVYHIYRTRSAEIYEPEKIMSRNTMLKEVRPFLIYPWVFLVMLLVPLANRLAGYSSYNNAIIFFWMLNALVSPFQGGIAAVIFGMNFDKKTYMYLCCRQGTIEEYPIRVPSRTDSYKTESLMSYDSLTNE